MKHILIICLALLPGTKHGFAQTIPRWKTLPDIPAMPNADTSGLASVNGARLYFAVFNKTGKDPVILLHGGFSSSEDWGFEVPLLATTHRVIVMDTRGHGRSTMDDRPFSYALFASDVKGLMDILRVPKASVVGWSDGGITGLVMAMKYPAYIKKLFTYGSNYNKSGERHEPFDSALAAKFMNRVKENYRRLSPTPDGFANLRAQIIKLYSTEPDLDTTALHHIGIPVVIGCGEYEQFYTRAHFESLARLIPGARLVVMPAVSHGGPIQDPGRFHKEVSRLLDNTR
ncbi:MAG TPA: alpha/beta hydrolase [Puia sp.]|nr:alpha/beta hydrolase [Puia sp.]